MTNDFDAFVDSLLELDARERRQLPHWQQLIATFADFAVSAANEGLELTLSNHAYETDKFVQSLEAIGATEVAGAVANLSRKVSDEKLGDEDGWDLSAVYDHLILAPELERVSALFSAQEHSLWDAAEAFARARGWKPAGPEPCVQSE